MHRIDTPTAQTDKFGAGKNGFTRGNPQTGVPATALDDDYFDAIQEEITGVVESTGIALDKTNRTQLLTALKKLFLRTDNNFSEIAAAGSAAVTEALANLGISDNLIPVGTPLPWPMTIPPSGWFKCNGSAFDKLLNPKLAIAYPSGVLPDLRGEFIRGWDDGRGVDTGRSLLSSQIGSKLRACASTATGSAGNGANIWHNVEFDQIETITLYSVATNATGLPFQVGIVRPRNLAFNYIVRAA